MQDQFNSLFLNFILLVLIKTHIKEVTQRMIIRSSRGMFFETR